MNCSQNPSDQGRTILEIEGKTVDELTKESVNARASELLQEWSARQRGATRSASPTLFATLDVMGHYLPYLLATIFYSIGVYSKVSSPKETGDVSKRVHLWINESIDRVLQFAPRGRVDQEQCRAEFTSVAEDLVRALGEEGVTATADVLSNKLFNILRRYDATAGEKERGLVDYIARAELKRLLS